MRRIFFFALLLAAVCIPAALLPAVRPALASTEHCFKYTHPDMTIYENQRTQENNDTDHITLARTCTVPDSTIGGISDWRVEWGDGRIDYTPTFDPRADDVGVACYNDSTNGRLCFPCTECPLFGAHSYGTPGVYTVNVYYQAGCCV